MYFLVESFYQHIERKVNIAFPKDVAVTSYRKTKQSFWPTQYFSKATVLFHYKFCVFYLNIIIENEEGIFFMIMYNPRLDRTLLL